MFVRVRQQRVFSPPIGFSERIAAAVIRRRVAHIVPFVVVLVSLSLKFFSLLDLWGKHTRRRVVVGVLVLFTLLLSFSLSSRRAFRNRLSRSLFSLSLSFLSLSLSLSRRRKDSQTEALDYYVWWFLREGKKNV